MNMTTYRLMLEYTYPTLVERADAVPSDDDDYGYDSPCEKEVVMVTDKIEICALETLREAVHVKLWTETMLRDAQFGGVVASLALDDKEIKLKGSLKDAAVYYEEAADEAPIKKFDIMRVGDETGARLAQLQSVWKNPRYSLHAPDWEGTPIWGLSDGGPLRKDLLATWGSVEFAKQGKVMAVGRKDALGCFTAVRLSRGKRLGIVFHVEQSTSSVCRLPRLPYWGSGKGYDLIVRETPGWGLEPVEYLEELLRGNKPSRRTRDTLARIRQDTQALGEDISPAAYLQRLEDELREFYAAHAAGDVIHAQKELGDVILTAQLMCTAMGVEPNKLAKASAAKVVSRLRYMNGDKSRLAEAKRLFP